MLKEMWEMWEGINFDLAPYKGGTFIIRGYDDIQATLDEHIVNTQVIQFSAFKKPFEEEIVSWYGKLKTVSDVMEEWMKCQGQWMYLQPIFDSGDISKQLPAESKKFRSVDNLWKANMQLAKQYGSVMQVCCTEGLLEKFRECNDKLEQIQKSLNEYLEKKREKFARFYFLSNDDLLEILSQTKEPTAVQPHLKKVFENIHAIEFTHKKTIVAMFSAEKEKVDFVEEVNPNDKNVEDWMNEVEGMMCQSIRWELRNSVDKYPETKRTQWTCNHPGQCILNGSQVWWTTLVEEAIAKKDIRGYFALSTEQLNDLVELVRQPLTKQQQVTINALIVIDVHAKDVV
jgi:dynein heavy chain, axonemal